MGQLTAMQMANRTNRKIQTLQDEYSEDLLFQVIEDGEVLDSFLNREAAEVFAAHHGIPSALLLAHITRRYARIWDHLDHECSRSEASEYLFAYLGLIVRQGDSLNGEKFRAADELEDHFIEILDATPIKSYQEP